MPHKETLPVLAMLLLVMAGCHSSEISRLHKENDSLRQELHFLDTPVQILNNVKVWLDSIDINRDLLLTYSGENASYEQYSSRLTDVNEFVKTSEIRIGRIREALSSSAFENSQHKTLVAGLRREVQLRAYEITILREQIRMIDSQNHRLRDQGQTLGKNLIFRSDSVLLKDSEIRFLQARVAAMLAGFKVAEADAYYWRARAVEETAQRTKLAPRKRKETYREALELYRKAWSLGKRDAQARISELERRLK